MRGAGVPDSPLEERESRIPCRLVRLRGRYVHRLGFTGDGVQLAAWGVDVGTIAGLAVDAQGRVYVAASETKQIVRYVP